MAVLFDTAPLPSRDRLEAFRTAMLDASGSTRIDLDSTEGVRGQMALWSFGRARVFTAASTGISMSRDARAARGASTEAVAVAVHGGGTGRHVTAAGQRTVRSGDLMVVDITRPFEFSWRGQAEQDERDEFVRPLQQLFRITCPTMTQPRMMSQPISVECDKCGF